MVMGNFRGLVRLDAMHDQADNRHLRPEECIEKAMHREKIAAAAHDPQVKDGITASAME